MWKSYNTMDSSSTVCRNKLRARSIIVYLRSLAIILLCVLKWTHAQSSLSEADIQELVDAHNLFRSMVEPQATNIERVEWNTELAGVAQAYAEMCIFRDNPNRADQAPSFPTVGENLSASNTRTPNYTEFVERAWFSQRVNYNYDTNTCSSPGSCTDYVQLVWASTTQLGCGVSRCTEIDGGLPDSVILVCNYAPEGNIEDGRPYISGDVCSSCPEGSLCVDNLCTPITTTLPITTMATTSPPPTTTEDTLTPTTTEAPTTETASTDTTTGDQQGTVTTPVVPVTTIATEMPTSTTIEETTTTDSPTPTDTTAMETTTEVTTVATTMVVTTTNRPTRRPKPTKDPCAIYKLIIWKLKWQLRWRKYYYTYTVPTPGTVPMTGGRGTITSKSSSKPYSESSRSRSRTKSSQSRKHQSRSSRSRTSRSKSGKRRSRKRG